MCMCYVLKTDFESHDISLFTGVRSSLNRRERKQRVRGRERTFHSRLEKRCKNVVPWEC